MPNVYVDLSHSKINNYLENSVSLDNIYQMNSKQDLTQNAYNTIDINAGCMRIVPKFFNILRGLIDKKVYYNLKVVEFQNSEPLNYLTISNTAATSELFETLNKLGIYVSELKIATNLEMSKVYFTKKILRDITRLNSVAQQQIMLYLISVSYFFFKITISQNLDFVYDSYSKRLYITEEFFKDFTEYVKSFTNENYIVELLEIPSDPINFIKTFNGTYETFNKNTFEGNLTVKVASLYRENPQDEYLVLTLRPSYYILINKNLKEMYTNSEMIYLDLDTLSIFSKLLEMTEISTTIKYESDITKLFNKTDIISVEETEHSDLRDFISKIAKTYTCEFDIDIKELENKLSFKFNKAAGIIDPLEIKNTYANDEFAQQLYSNIPEYYNNFNLKNLNSLVKGLAKENEIYSLMFTGNSGTGKSTSAKVLALRTGIPYLTINFTVNIEESDLIGTLQPNYSKKDANDPEFIWQDGLLTKAVRNGYVIVLEELNFARPGVLGKLNSLLDESRQIDLPSGEIVRAHKNFRMIATCNVGYEGTNRYNKALINRFDMCINFEDPDKKETFEIIKSRTGYTDESKFNKVYSVYTAIKKYSAEQNLDVVVSIRQLLNIFTKGKYFKTADEAIRNIMINSAFIEDSDYKNEFLNSIYSVFQLSFKI